MQQQEVSKQRVLKHIVALQFKEEVSKEQREQAIQNFRDLQGEIPQIMAFEGGEEISVEELAKGFTHCFILTFKDEKQLEIFISLIQHILGLQSKTSPCLATC
ncbi:MAG: Dabb family protein [Bacteroidota bacterium]